MAARCRSLWFGFRRYRFFSSEPEIIAALAELIPLDSDHPNLPNPTPQLSCPPPDIAGGGRITSEERLRGVFLQKLHGRAAIFAALSAASRDVLMPTTFHNVLNRGSISGANMVVFFDWARAQPGLALNVEMYHVVLRALGRSKFFRFFGDIFNRMAADGVRPDARTLEVVVDSFVAARQVSEAVHWFKKYEDVGGVHDTASLNVVLHCLCRRSHVKVANSLFGSMKGIVNVDRVSYDELMSGWARYGRVDKVESLWAMLIEDGLEPSAGTYRCLLEALGRTGRIDDAVGVFEKMETNGCTPNTLVYNAIIHNFTSTGDMDKCIEYYNKMCKCDCKPDANTYRIIIKAYVKVRRIADALKMFDDMLSRRIMPSTTFVTSLIEPLCSFGPPHAAMVIYKKSKRCGCEISLKAYKLLLARLSQFGKSGMVLKLLEEMRSCGHSSDKEVYEYIVNGLCNIGKVDAAVLMVEESLESGVCLGRVVYSKLNNKLLDMNKAEIAYNLFRKIKGARRAATARNYWRSNGWHF